MTRSHVIRGGVKSIAGRGANASALGSVGAVWITFLGPQPARPNPASAMPPVLKKFRLSMLIILGRNSVAFVLEVDPEQKLRCAREPGLRGDRRESADAKDSRRLH